MTSQSAATQSPSGAGRAEPGAASRAPGWGWGRGRSATERERARPSPRSAAADREPWSPTTAHGRSSLRSRCWSLTWTRRRRSRYRQGGAAGLGEGLGTWPWDLNPCLTPARYRTSSGTHSSSLWGSPCPPPTARPRLDHQYGSLWRVSPRVSLFTPSPAMGSRPLLRHWRPYNLSHLVNPLSFPAKWHC